MRYRIFISTGEVSGDYQGSALVKALHKEAALHNLELEIFALGGEQMAAAGATLWGNTAEIGSIGLIEALRFVLPSYLLQNRVKQKIRSHPIDLAILIDYVTPNVAMGKFLKKHFPATPVVYYIAPQEWVWEFKGNSELITEFSHRIFSVFPAEARFYEAKGANVTWVGHPLVGLMAQVPDRLTARQKLGIDPDVPVMALLPASRIQELHFLLPIMLDAAQILQDRLPELQFWLPISRPSYRDRITKIVAQYPFKVHLVEGNPHLVIRSADLVLTKSGTVNLETALLGVPQVVLYRVSALTAWLARKILKFHIPFMSPPNLVLMEPIVPEFFQEGVKAEPIAACCWELLTNPAKRSAMLAHYDRVRAELGDGQTVEKTAQEIMAILLKKVKI